MDLRIRISGSDLLGLSRLERNQLPFAAASAVTAIAKRVQEAETKALSSTFDTPTPFTMRAFGVKGARKSNPTAVVFAKDKQAAYLQPYEVGGTQVLGDKQGMLEPINVPLNAAGNLPRNKLKSLKARSDVFIGPVKFKKSGQTINGVWQRNPVERGARRGRYGRYSTSEYGTRGAHSDVDGVKTTLKLLIRFTDPKPVKLQMGYEQRAASVVHQVASAEVAAALRRAIASAR